PLVSLTTQPAPTEIHTLSLHDALPIYGPTLSSIPPPKTYTPASFASWMTACDSSHTAAKSSSDSTIAALGNEIRYLLIGTPCLTDRKSTRLNSSHVKISYAVFCLKKKR